MIGLRDLHKRYETGGSSVHALRGVDLDILSGELVAVMGPSGSGKTTLLEILGCLSRPTSGSYRLRDVELDAYDETELARLRGREIGFVFQAFNLLPRLTLLENVQLPLVYQRVGRKERSRRAKEALARVKLAHRGSHRPGLVSGGERQRAAVARALVTRPSLVLADEPTGNLDTDRGEEVLGLLEDLHREEGTTVVIVTHDVAIGARAKRCIRIRDGRIEDDARRVA